MAPAGQLALPVAAEAVGLLPMEPTECSMMKKPLTRLLALGMVCATLLLLSNYDRVPQFLLLSRPAHPQRTLEARLPLLHKGLQTLVSGALPQRQQQHATVQLVSIGTASHQKQWMPVSRLSALLWPLLLAGLGALLVRMKLWAAGSDAKVAMMAHTGAVDCIGDALHSVEHPPAPWKYTGRAYIQLSFMKADVAKAHLPPGLVLDSSLEQFGYTYGGFFLAEYDTSPFGSFWELVVICGLVWNREPTLKDILLGLFTAPSADTDVGRNENSRSTWASHVFVSSRAARDHGREIFGLLSNDAHFTVTDALDSPEGQPRQQVVVHRGLAGDGEEVATLLIPKRGLNKAKLPPAGFGPLKLSLPSLSGCSEYVPQLLHYSVDLSCKTSLVVPACKVTVPEGSPVKGIMGLDPLICINFEDMTMDVPEPLPFN